MPDPVQPFFCTAPIEIQIHLEIHVLVPSGESNAQVRRTQLDPEVHGAERVPERAIQKCLLAVRSVLRARGRSFSGAAGRRQLAMREQASVRRQQTATGRRVVTRRAARVLFGEKHRFGPRR